MKCEEAALGKRMIPHDRRDRGMVVEAAESKVASQNLESMIDRECRKFWSFLEVE